MDLLRVHSSSIQTSQLNYAFFPTLTIRSRKGTVIEKYEFPTQSPNRAILRAIPTWHISRPSKSLPVQTSCTSKGSFAASEIGTCKSVQLDEHDGISDAVDEHKVLLKKMAKEVVMELKGTCIFLIGMMGSGKSTVGRILAEALGYCFFDSDKLVEQAAGGASVAEIFKEKNEEGFRDAETEVLKQLSCMGRLVVATGGGIVVRPINWSYLRDGVTVWLDVPLEALAKRVVEVSLDSRPLLEVSTTDFAYNQALESLTRIFDQRGPAYAEADAVVSLQKAALRMGYQDVSFITPTVIAIQVLEEINKLLQHKKKLDKAAGA